jgi:antitoxin component YwqK of YwqJK toxin-antitoxin module
MNFHPNMQPKDEGLYVNDLKHGYWKYYQPTGNLIRTEKWIMGVLQEDSKEISKVDVRRTLDPKTGRIAEIGAYLNGKKEGVHRQYDANGNVIGSQFYQENRILAEGIYDEQGRRQGPWKYYYWEGELKEFGDYKDNNKVGAWKYLFQDGKLEQQGNYTAGKPAGEWKWFYPNGELRREMEYVNGEPDGPSFEYDETGNIISEGEYVDGFKEGKWRYVYGDIIETGAYFEGEQNGDWSQVDRLTGTMRYEGGFVSGEKNGKHVWYHENGNVYRRGFYEMGSREGIWETFDVFGNLTFTIEYKNGKEIKYNGKRITYGKRVDRALAAEEEDN